MQIKCISCQSLIDYKKDESLKNLGRVIGGLGGGWLGSSMGIAAFGTAISGLLPVAIIGAIVLGNAMDDSDEITCPHCRKTMKLK